jgi:hypothetical protein
VVDFSLKQVGRLRGFAWKCLKMNGLGVKSEMILQVVDISPVITDLHDFSAHFSPVRGLVSRRLGRKRGINNKEAKTQRAKEF